jgi:hypothetical protein
MSWNTRTPSDSTPAGSSVCGAMTRTSGVPSVVRPWISERATRECRMSPTTATVRREKILLVVPDREQVEQPLRRVGVASVACVDHVLVRLDTARDQERRAARCVAHDEHGRPCIAERFATGVEQPTRPWSAMKPRC